MAEVWLAQRTSLGTRKSVALKLLAPHLADNPQYRAMFVEEARLSMLLNHSNIVQVFDVGEHRGDCYLAMEWVDGVNLAELQAALWEHGRTVPIGVAMYIVAEVLRALDYAHNLTHDGSATIVHRDVSPANVMLSRAGEVKLTDFGVARFGTEETSGIHVKGKLRYMAPEQLQGQSRTGAVDLFSVGALLHEMLDGERFRGSHTDEAALIGMVCEGLVPKLGASKAIPQPLDTLRRALLEPDLTRRLTRAREALQRLCACPGYHEAALELEALVAWVQSLEPERSATSERSATGARARNPEEDRTVRALLRARPGPRNPARLGPAMRAARITAASALAISGLGVGCLGIRVAMSPPPTPVVALGSTAALAGVARVVAERSAAAAEAAVRAGSALREREPASEPVPVPVPDAALEPEPEPEQPSESAANPEPPPEAAEPKPEPKPEPKITHDPVPVRFVAGSFRFAYLKVGTKRLLIEPGGTVELAPGTHKVQARFSADEPWSSFGRVRVRAERPLVVKLVAPHGLEVEPQP